MTAKTAPRSPRVVEPLWKAADVVAYLAGTVTEGTLANWRVSGKGPPYIKLGGRGTAILYRPAAVEAWAARFEQNAQEPRRGTARRGGEAM